jgi:hypothetical protein
MIKKSKGDDPQNNQSSKDDETIGILKMEYTSLLNLYTHTEDTINGVFNFYLTLLSAITGATIVLFQINNTNIVASYPSVAGLLIFTILIGVITQDSIVNKNVDLSNFTLGLNLLKYRLFQNRVAEMPYIFYLENFWANVSPIPPRKTDNTARIQKKLWWFFPLGTHQLFISIINSFALAALLIITVQLIAGNLVFKDKLIIGGIFVLITSFQINNIYAQLKHKRGLQRFNNASNTAIPWSKEAG